MAKIFICKTCEYGDKLTIYYNYRDNKFFVRHFFHWHIQHTGE